MPPRPRTATPPRPARPLVVTADRELLDDLLRLAAAADTELQVAVDPAGARRDFAAAPLVLIGVDQAAAWAAANFPPRRDVVLLARDHSPAASLAAAVGASHVALLPDADHWLVARLGEPAPALPARRGRTVAVLGGRGGAGGSVLAAALAHTAAQSSLRTLLVDADPLGGGLDLLLGWEELDGLRWPELAAARGRVAAPALVRALPGRGGLSLLSWDRGVPATIPVEAMAAALDAGRRGRDLVVVDLPRHLPAAAAHALAAAERALVVVPAELRATAAAARVVAAAAVHQERIEAVVRGPAPGHLRALEVVTALGVPLAGTLRPEPGLAAALERGQPPTRHRRGPLATLCRQLLADLLGPSRSVAA
ncbi:septum formation initiator [Pilimelia terevasa]|uniref:Septum formation initiator n=1 Tax=Pilimelia terevasa TaxID=53372 RepID=A0A8J3BGQ1_9ACTN|nr:septum site-determining protein Ssd [Pilimelia terevasa]GGK20808.1 septum formation initiator [Pilimelia terevasa]